MKVKYFLVIPLAFLIGCNNEGADSKKENSPVDSIQVIAKDAGSEKSLLNANLSDESYDMSYFSGQAEVATYSLEKARYEDVHPGEAVLVFVAEPFSIKNQVKADRPNAENSVKALKMNRIDRFSTGVYDYSQFTSVFTPYEKFDAKFPMKITMGSQDWCGQSFYQINNRNGFEFSQKSYFESKGDTVLNIEYAVPEDNIMNLIRISKDLLPIGDFDVIPSASYLASSNTKVKSYLANGAIVLDDDGFVYEYEIPELSRSVKIYVTTENQNRISKWEETYPTVFDGVSRTSVYVLKGVKVMPYWRMNSSEDEGLRKEMNLLY